MISLKKGAIIDHRTHPSMFEAMYVVDRVCYHNYAIRETVITSGNDGKHMKGSMHYEGKALDFRVHHWPLGVRNKILIEVKRGLGDDYDILLESLGTPNEHLHVEYDPKPKRS